MVKNTDFSIDDQKKAFKKLIINNKTKNNMIIYQNNIIIEQSSINNCLYCNNKLTKKYAAIIQLNKIFGRFCNTICRDIYLNLHQNIYNLSHSAKNIKLFPFSLFKDGDSLIDFFKSITYSSILNFRCYYLESRELELEFICNNELNEIININKKFKINELLTENSEHDTCLYCNIKIKKQYFIETQHNTYIGPFCDDICKYSFGNLLSGPIKSKFSNKLFLPSNNIIGNDFINAKNVIKNYNNIYRGLNKFYFNDINIYIEILFFTF